MPAPGQPALSFVIPLFNSADTIAPLVREIAALRIEGGHEIVLVNDGSADRTAGVCRELLRAGGVTITPVINQNTTYFTEEDVKIANTASLTALKVTIVMQRASGLSYSGEYNTVGSQITQANSSTASAITYSPNSSAMSSRTGSLG